MSTAATTSTAHSAASPRAQWRAVSRHFVRAGLTQVVGAAIATALVGLLALAVALALGWQYAVSGDGATVGVEADSQGVAIVAPLPPWPMLLLLQCGLMTITAVAMAAVLPAQHVRVLIAAGATRRSLTIGLLLALITLTAAVALAVLALVLVAGRPSWLIAGSATPWFDIGLGVLGLFVSLVGVAAITLTFMRWPWWVGTIIVTAAVILGPGAAASLGWQGVSAALGLTLASVVAVAALVLVMRRLPAR